MVHIRPSIPEKCPHDQDQLPFPQSRTTYLQPRLAITREQSPSHVPAIECTALGPNGQTVTAGNFCGAPSTSCSKHMVLQAHGTSKHQAPSTWHAACLPRGEARYPHSAEYWQAGDMLTAQAMRPNLQNVCPG